MFYLLGDVSVSTVLMGLQSFRHAAFLYWKIFLIGYLHPFFFLLICDSGCAHCIYDIYEEDRQEYKAKLAKVLDEISKAGLPPPPNISNIKTGRGDSASIGDAQSANDEDDMDPGMKAFLELERKLKGS